MAVVNLEILLKLPKNPGDGESVHVIDEVDVSQDGDGDLPGEHKNFVILDFQLWKAVSLAFFELS